MFALNRLCSVQLKQNLDYTCVLGVKCNRLRLNRTSMLITVRLLPTFLSFDDTHLAIRLLSHLQQHRHGAAKPSSQPVYQLSICTQNRAHGSRHEWQPPAERGHGGVRLRFWLLNKLSDRSQ
eukprot:scpid28644/ scgid27079/ 